MEETIEEIIEKLINDSVDRLLTKKPADDLRRGIYILAKRKELSTDHILILRELRNREEAQLKNSTDGNT